MLSECCFGCATALYVVYQLVTRNLAGHCLKVCHLLRGKMKNMEHFLQECQLRPHCSDQGIKETNLTDATKGTTGTLSRQGMMIKKRKEFTKQENTVTENN